jgi:hypothetical protein
MATRQTQLSSFLGRRTGAESYMNTKQLGLLINLNRVLIFVLTLVGLLMDGAQLADLPCTFALLVWLWLPVFTRMEANILKRVGTF